MEQLKKKKSVPSVQGMVVAQMRCNGHRPSRDADCSQHFDGNTRNTKKDQQIYTHPFLHPSQRSTLVPEDEAANDSRATIIERGQETGDGAARTPQQYQNERVAKSAIAPLGEGMILSTNCSRSALSGTIIHIPD
jgi:hypothetical protein